MLRKDREIGDPKELAALLERCDTLRIGLFGEEYPYVVPVSFGVDAAGPEIRLYVHGTNRGLRAELLEKNPNVCVEGDIFYRVEPTRYGITARYESVIGRGTARRIDGEEKVEGLRRILSHYGRFDYPVDRCKGLDAASVWRITLHEVTGKRNLGD